MSSNCVTKDWRYLVSFCFWAWASINCQYIYIFVLLVLFACITYRRSMIVFVILLIEWLRRRTKRSLNFLMTMRIFVNLWNQDHLSVSFFCLLKYLLNFTWHLILSHNLVFYISSPWPDNMINNLRLITMIITTQVWSHSCYHLLAPVLVR